MPPMGSITETVISNETGLFSIRYFESIFKIVIVRTVTYPSNSDFNPNWTKDVY